MSTLRIEHQTTYSYSRPVEFGRHRLVLRPREGHDVRVISMSLRITPAHRLLWSRDVFGNSIAIVDFTEMADTLQVSSHVVVRRVPSLSVDAGPDSPWSVRYPVLYDPLETQVVAAYQTASYPDDVEELRSWLDQNLKLEAETDAEGVNFALAKLIHGQVKYSRRPERGVQPPAQTLKLGPGSCRDMATLMMDAARLLGLATRFASGYLHCAASQVGRASTHAWAEIYLPSLGWKGYDPSIGELTSLKHVVVGVSNHPRGVMPVSGMFTGASSDYRDMQVQVKTEELAEVVPDGADTL